MKTKTTTAKAKAPPVSRRTHFERQTGDSLRIRNILVPLDFSPASYAALRFALPWLEQFGAELHLMHVMPDISTVLGVANLPIVVPDAEVSRRIRRDLSRAIEKQGFKTPPGHLHIRRGSPFEEICDLAQRTGSDLIAIATRGNTGFKHLALGSTAERVVRYSPCPVLVVRDSRLKNTPGKNGNGGDGMGKVRRILVPIDFSDCSIRGLAYAKQLAREFGATVVLLHSVAIPYLLTNDEYARYDFPLLMMQSEKIARQQMRGLIAKTEREGVKVNSSIQIGHAGQQICARADAEPADLIVTSTHGHTGLKHMLVGSTAEYVIRHASCPVLVVPTRPIPSIKAS